VSLFLPSGQGFQSCKKDAEPAVIEKRRAIPCPSHHRSPFTVIFHHYSSLPAARPQSLSFELIVYEVGFGFIFLLPPVMVTLTKRRVYTTRFFARPLGTFFFSCGSTCIALLVSHTILHDGGVALGRDCWW